MKNKKILITLSILIFLTIIGTSSYFLTKNIKKSNNKVVISDKSDNDEDDGYNFELNFGEEKTIIDLLNLNNSDKIEVISNSNPEIVSIENNTIKTLAEGISNLILNINNETIVLNIEVKVKTSNASNVDFKLSSCKKPTDKIYVTGKNDSNILVCIQNYELFYKNKHVSAQDFAISDKYIYLSGPFDGTWSSDKTNSKISTTHIVRIKKNNSSEIDRMYVKNAGHGHMDVSKKNDTIYMNGFGYTSFNTSKNKYIGNHRGVTFLSFKKNLQTPNTGIMISKNGEFLLKVNDYNKLSEKDIQNYDKKYEESTTQFNDQEIKTYLSKPDMSIDEENNRIAIYRSGKVYIYNLQEFKKGNKVCGISINQNNNNCSFIVKTKLARKYYKSINNNNTPIKHEKTKKVNISVVNEALDGDYFYIAYGGIETNVAIRKYSIKTGKLEKSVTLNFKDFYYNKGKRRYEAEGISIYNKEIYLMLINRTCKTDNCSSKRPYIDIFKITNM